jgi:hypothetical protein
MHKHACAARSKIVLFSIPHLFSVNIFLERCWEEMEVINWERLGYSLTPDHNTTIMALDILILTFKITSLVYCKDQGAGNTL